MDFKLMEEAVKQSEMLQAWIPLVLAGASALSSYLAKRGKNKQESTSTRNETDVSTPEYDPALWGARNTLLNQYLNRLKGGQGWLTGVTGQGLRDINRASDIRSKSLSNILSARGLSSSPVAANLMGGLEGERLSKQVDFLGQIPLMARQAEGEDMNALAQYIASLPKGMRTSTQGSYTGNQASYGSPMAAVGQAGGDAVSAFLMAQKYSGQKW